MNKIEQETMTDMHREAFERWAKSKYLDISMVRGPWGDPVYEHSHIGAMWEGWQAAMQENAK